MFAVPIDAWYVWLGLAAVSAVLLGIAGAVSSPPPPDAAGAAAVVDGVAASEHPAVGEHPLAEADMVRIGADGLTLRGPTGESHAAFGYGPVAPAGTPRLARVLEGVPPAAVFETPTAFAAALRAARERPPAWRPAGGLAVRRVTWEDVDATLVG